MSPPARSPLATNVTEVRPSDESWELTRTRWGGSLLEEASLAPVKLATVAPHALRGHRSAGERPLQKLRARAVRGSGADPRRGAVTISEGIT